MEKLTGHFKMIGLQGEDPDKILNAFTFKTFKKNDFVVETGKISRHIGLVESGLFQYYVIKDGEKRTT